MTFLIEAAFALAVLLSSAGSHGNLGSLSRSPHEHRWYPNIFTGQYMSYLGGRSKRSLFFPRSCRISLINLSSWHGFCVRTRFGASTHLIQDDKKEQSDDDLTCYHEDVSESSDKYISVEKHAKNDIETGQISQNNGLLTIDFKGIEKNGL